MNEKEATWLIVLLSLAAWVWAGGGLLLPSARGAETVWWHMCRGILAGCGAAFGVFCVVGSLTFNQNASSGWCSWRACSFYVYFFAALHIKMPANIPLRIKLEPGVWPEKRICIACHRFIAGLLVGRG